MKKIQVFHGSEKIFTSFNPALIGSMRNFNSFCFWFTSKMEVAQDYGFLIYNCEIKLKQPLIVSSEQFKDERHGPPYWAKKALYSGFDGVLLKGIVDNSYYIESNIYGVFDPENIKILSVDNQWED